MSKYTCNKCGGQTFHKYPRGKHMRLDCTQCGAYKKFIPEHEHDDYPDKKEEPLFPLLEPQPPRFCEGCEYYCERVDKGKLVAVRRFCYVTGEKTTPKTKACEHYK